MDSPFAVLRVDPTADEEEIERAYRRRVLETHPDQNGSTREFRRVQAAYEAIKSERGLPGRTHAGSDPDPDPDAADADADSPDGREKTRVEYLNYEVLDDYGWSLDDDDLFEKASDEGLTSSADCGRFLHDTPGSLLQGAEDCGFTWPYSCRGGACANCAVAVTEGELEMPVDHILPEELMDQGIRLSCVGQPVTDELQVVYNVKHLPDLDDLLLPPRSFDGAAGSD
ncbi:ferredoxin Fer [Halostella salina]|uniref:ferredoxin Fer n=1 Tax=Halostella salina TaxID=1547897 RepID=UPI000EF7678C|nr:ferredoxin Fer [Halostella salina]